MSATPVERLNAALEGRYRIERELGEGGMATVYLADDLRHERKVALKVLKPELAAVVGAERFLAEIKTTANLQHPHILPLFDSGEADSFLFYVMPYVEGETLRDRLDREHQLPVDDAVQIAKNVAEALDYAHKQGVIHRDIKPANILLHAGKPVISDFGIALAVGVAGGGRLTETGLSLGTPHYMSPEQATGDLSVGAATDVYALGCVLYEMLVGEPPYTGSTAQAILGKIIAGELASATKHRRSVPPNVDAAIRKALEKVPADRFQSAAGFCDGLGDPSFDVDDSRHRPYTSTRRWSAVGWLGVGAALALAIAAPFLEVSRRDASTYFPIRTPTGVHLVYDLANPGVAVSPDGRGLVYVGSSDRRQIYWQDLRQPGDARVISGTEGAAAPFFSPDGEWVGFFADNKLQKVSLRGGDPVDLASVAIHRGATWSPDGEYIYFSPNLRAGIVRIPADGGEAVQLTQPTYGGEDEGHWLPVALPDGNGVLYTKCCANFTVMHLDVSTGVSTAVLRNAFGARYAPSGHLVFAQGGALMAARFDLRELTTGNPVELRGDLITGHEFQAEFGFGQDGTFAYLAGPSWWERRLVRIDRSGRSETLTADPEPIILNIAISREGDRVALTLAGANSDIIEFDLARRTRDRLTSDANNDFKPLWTLDSRRVVYSSARGGGFDLYASDVSGSGEPELLYTSEYAKWADSWSPGDSLLILTRDHPETGWDLMVLDAVTGGAEEFRAGPSNEGRAAFSPDGRSVAYTSDRSGAYEIYVAPFPGPGDECQVSVGGGDDPRWSANGELFYLVETTVMVVPQDQLTPICRPSPERLIDGVELLTWDASPDGDFFVTVEQRPEPRLFLALDWFAELERLVPN